MDIVDSINALCKNTGTSLSAIEKKLGFGKGTIYRWDANNPSVDRVAKVADYFNVSVDYLLSHEQSEGADIADGACLNTRIFDLISTKGVSQTKFAKAIGAKSPTVSTWKNRGSLPSADMLPKIADYFGVSVDYLLGRKHMDGTDLAFDTFVGRGMVQIIEAVKAVQLLPQELMRLNGEVARLTVKVESLGEQNQELRTKNQELAQLVVRLRKQVNARNSLSLTRPKR